MTTTMRTPHQPSVWPPELPQDELQELADQAVLYALSHGLMFLPPSSTIRTRAPAIAQHAPFSLFPSLYPRRLFNLAKKLQHTYNVLYARIAMDAVFLDGIMGEETGVGRVDPFMGRLWRVWKDHREEGIVQVRLWLASVSCCCLTLR
jgi:glutathione synthase